VALLLDAVVGRRVVEFDYAGRGGAPRRRGAEPWGLVDKDGTWYLVAGTRPGGATFRLDRMGAPAVTGEGFERPADLDLPGAWDEVVGEMERRRSPVDATVLVPARLVPVLRDRFGRHCTVAGRAGRRRAGAPAGGGAHGAVGGRAAGRLRRRRRVTEPAAVRAELARSARAGRAHGSSGQPSG
jgi:hypothetical protein